MLPFCSVPGWCEGYSGQVPQFILDEMIFAGRGGFCNIVCTQPRRIAVSFLISCQLQLFLHVCNKGCCEFTSRNHSDLCLCHLHSNNDSYFEYLQFLFLHRLYCNHSSQGTYVGAILYFVATLTLEMLGAGQAISVAERVAVERCDPPPGNSRSLDGYQVRLDAAW